MTHDFYEEILRLQAATLVCCDSDQAATLVCCDPNINSAISGLKNAGCDSDQAIEQAATLVCCDRNINSVTNKLKNASCDLSSEISELEGKTRATPPPLVREASFGSASEGLLGEIVNAAEETPHTKIISMRDQIAGIEIQKKSSTKQHSMCFMMTVQFHTQVKDRIAFKFTAYLQSRKANKHFRKGLDPFNEFECGLYDLCVENKTWWLGRVTERGYGGERIDGYVVIFKPETNCLYLCFDDLSQPIEIPVDNKPMSDRQKQFYESSGIWGEPIKIVTSTLRRPEVCRTIAKS